jgi:hypothetical protein
VTKKKGEE